MALEITDNNFKEILAEGKPVEIRNIPTVLVFKNGDLVDKQVGSAPKPTYAAKIEALL